jgi:hypothetical protein
LTHAPAVFSAGTVNADFSLRVDGRLERGASLIATDLLCTSGGRDLHQAPAGSMLVVDSETGGFGLCGGRSEKRQCFTHLLLHRRYGRNAGQRARDG